MSLADTLDSLSLMIRSLFESNYAKLAFVFVFVFGGLSATSLRTWSLFFESNYEFSVFTYLALCHLSKGLWRGWTSVGGTPWFERDVEEVGRRGVGRGEPKGRWEGWA